LCFIFTKTGDLGLLRGGGLIFIFGTSNNVSTVCFDEFTVADEPPTTAVEEDEVSGEDFEGKCCRLLRFTFTKPAGGGGDSMLMPFFTVVIFFGTSDFIATAAFCFDEFAAAAKYCSASSCDPKLLYLFPRYPST